jgi:hypothetical protein
LIYCVEGLGRIPDTNTAQWFKEDLMRHLRTLDNTKASDEATPNETLVDCLDMDLGRYNRDTRIPEAEWLLRNSKRI